RFHLQCVDRREHIGRERVDAAELHRHDGTRAAPRRRLHFGAARCEHRRICVPRRLDSLWRRAMPETLPISTEHCTIERDGAVVIITMNRPEKRNALSPAMLVGLADAYTYVDDTDEVRAAVLTGAGGTFSSGMDLTAMNQ